MSWSLFFYLMIIQDTPPVGRGNLPLSKRTNTSEFILSRVEGLALLSILRSRLLRRAGGNAQDKFPMPKGRLSQIPL